MNCSVNEIHTCAVHDPRYKFSVMRDVLKEKVLWIGAFGYFVDLFDLVLYGAVRVESLKSLGYQGPELLSVGATLLNIQMAGLLLGGFIFGILGDRRGRTTALFGSILIYSLATFGNAFVHDFTGYAILRFLAGVGLAGELGAAITLVSETIPQNKRGMGSALVAAMGFLGAVCASLLSQSISWSHSYQVGGMLGLLLLFARLNTRESALYLKSKIETQKTEATISSFGSLKLLYCSRARLKWVCLSFLVGVPTWYVAGILSFFAPEFAKSFEVQGDVSTGMTILFGYSGAILGDIGCGLLSQKLQSRKKAIFSFAAMGALLAICHPLFSRHSTPEIFYWIRFAIGFGCGYSAILAAWIAELFGTNLRATATTSLTNLIRASIIPLSFGFKYLIPSRGLVGSSALLGVICFSLALLSILALPETFHTSLDRLDSHEKISFN